MKEIKIFVLIPVYNAEKYLEDCLKSILTQNYTAYEVILVDDGSTDHSGMICDRYAEQNPHVHVIHKENGGPFRARLTALEFIRKERETAGTYCVFVDADDELAMGALATINGKIKESSCDLLIYGTEKFSSSGVFYRMREDRGGDMLIDNMAALFRETIIRYTYHSLCQKATRTEMLFGEPEAHLKDIRTGEDLLQSLEIFKQNPKTMITPAILYRYRANPQGITHSFKLKRITDDLSAKQYTVGLIKSLNIWDSHDFDQYREKNLSLVARDIRDILQDSPSKREAIENLKVVYAHPFIQTFCLEGISKKSNIWLRMFAKQRYRSLSCLNFVRQVKRSIMH